MSFSVLTLFTALIMDMCGLCKMQPETDYHIDFKDNDYFQNTKNPAMPLYYKTSHF